jgi:hypothetical protein
VELKQITREYERHLQGQVVTDLGDPALGNFGSDERTVGELRVSLFQTSRRFFENSKTLLSLSYTMGYNLSFRWKPPFINRLHSLAALESISY